MNGLREYAYKKGIDDGTEITKLEDFFSNHEITQDLETAEKIRIKRYMWLIPICIIACFGTLYYASLGIVQLETAENSGIYRPSTLFDGIFRAFFVTFIAFTTIVGIFRKRLEGSIKEKILSKLAKQVYDKLDYDAKSKYAFGDLDTLRSVNILQSYDRVDKIEDSLGFTFQKDGKYALMQGYELQTSEMRGSGKNRKRVTTNHCYLLKTSLPQARINISKDILIKGDRADGHTHKVGIPVIFALVSGIFIAIFSHSIGIPIISAFFIGIIAYFLNNQYINKNRVKLESIEFEKLFDVHCEDQVTSRMIITPAFMDRLVLLVNKTKRAYEFLFRADTFYVKWNLGKAYLEINTWKKITHNIETFIDWYMEMKEIISFVEDMQFLYLSKTEQKFLGDIEVPQYETMSEKIGKKSLLGIGNTI